MSDGEVVIGRIVMYESIRMKGSEDNYQWFLVNRQYDYTDTQMIVNQCEDCAVTYQKQQMIHYKVYVDDEYFWIPDYACVVYNPEIPEEWQNKDKYAREKYEDKTPDMIQTSRDVFGQPIDNTYKIDINDRRYKQAIQKIKEQNRIMKRSKGYGKQPGQPEV